MAMEHTLQTRIVELREEATEGEVTQLTGQCPDLPFRQAQLRVHKEAVQLSNN
jgi:hypothetical protein